MSSHEIVLLQGAQSDLLSIYAAQGERAYLRVDNALGILRLFPKAGPMHYKGRIRRLPSGHRNVVLCLTLRHKGM